MLQKLNTKRGGFTLVEIMIVVAIIALLAAIAVPNFLRSRKRSQATQILEDMRIIDAAIDLYAIEHNKTGAGVAGAWDWDDLMKYVKTGTRLYTSMATNRFDILGHDFRVTARVDIDPNTNNPRVAIATASFDALSDVAPAEFWSPYIY
jgi:prepilin-type N-terminal cleavage/methylation domain-containing protein